MIPFYALRFRNSRNFLSDPAEAFPVLPGSPCATSADSPSTPAGTPDRKRSFADDNRGGVGSGMRGYRKPVVEDDKGQAERLADRTGNDDPSSGGSG